MLKLTPVKGVLQLIDDETGEVLDDVFFKTPHNHDTYQESVTASTTFNEPSMTDQSFKEDVDINTIMDRVRQGAQIPVPLPEHFGDGTNIPTLLEAHEQIANNNATFYLLDPLVRAEFQNSPRLWMEQVYKDLQAGNIPNLKRMGVDVELTPRPPVNPPGGSPAPSGAAPAGVSPGSDPAPATTTATS